MVAGIYRYNGKIPLSDTFPTAVMGTITVSDKYAVLDAHFFHNNFVLYLFNTALFMAKFFVFFQLHLQLSLSDLKAF